jgi:ATP/ADP translocase
MAGGVIAASLGIIFSILAMLFGLIFFPLKKFLKKRKDKKNKKNID